MMAALKLFWVLSAIVAVGCAAQVESSSPRENSSSEFDDDPIGYFTEQASEFFDEMFQEDNLQVDDHGETARNSEVTRGDFVDKIANYIKTKSVNFKVPFIGSMKMGARNLDSNELDFTVKFVENGVQEARKSKMKKILTPILVFILLKAITVVPLAIGALLLNSWQALQMSFISFIVSAGLAIFQLCKKIAENNAHAHIAAHGHWDTAAHAAARSFDDVTSGQKMAYGAYQS